MKIRRGASVACLTLLCALGLAGSAFAQTSALAVRIRQVSFDSSGTTRVLVSVTGSAVGTGVLPASDFSILENGKPVSDLRVDPLFATQSTPVAVALIMDVSGSTIGAPSAAARSAAKQFINSLPSGVRVEIIAFSDRAGIRAGFTSDKQRLLSVVDRLTPSGGTALYDAVSLGSAELQRQVGAQHNMVVFTDGDDTASKATLAGAINAVKAANAPLTGVLLATSQVNPNALRSLAGALKGGDFLSVSNISQLSGAFKVVAQSIASQYVLSYPGTSRTPTNLPIAVGVKVGSANATDQSVVLNGRQLPVQPGGGGPAPASADKPLVGAFSGKTGLYLGLGAAFVGILLFFGMLLYRPAGAEAERMLARRLKLYTRGKDKKKTREHEGVLGGTAVGRKAVELADKVPRSKQFDEKMQKQLDQAGWLLRSTEFVLLQVGGTIIGLIIGFGLLQRAWLGIVLAVIGGIVPRMVLNQRVGKRSSDFLSQLPDTLQLLSGSLQAGYGFMQALDTVSKESPPPTSTEFARVLSETRLGMPVDEALDTMADRVGGEDFRWVVMAINIQRQVGGNLATLLSTVANTLREREQVRRQIKVLSAEGRLSAVILVVLPFLLVGYLSVVNPHYLSQLTTATIGKIAILVALFLIGVGIVWMRKIIKIDV